MLVMCANKTWVACRFAHDLLIHIVILMYCLDNFITNGLKVFLFETLEDGEVCQDLVSKSDCLEVMVITQEIPQLDGGIPVLEQLDATQLNQLIHINPYEMTSVHIWQHEWNSSTLQL